MVVLMRVPLMMRVAMAMVLAIVHATDGAIATRISRKLELVNSEGPYLGVVIPNSFEMSPLLESASFVANETIPYIDFAGRRLRFGTIGGKKVVLVMTGLSMLNAGITTQLLVSLFEVEGVVHYGIAGNANPSLNIGDVAIPQYWAHTGLWNWQRNGDGPDDQLALEANGDYTREIGRFNFSDYITPNDSNASTYGSLLNSVWYQPEEVFPVDGAPENRQHAFWVPVDTDYYEIAKQLEDLKLEDCINSTTCLSEAPKVVTVHRGTSANVYLDNAAYRSFIYGKFEVSPVDMESASVALVCLQQRVPFIVIRALSDLAGGGSADSNEADTFSSLAAQNSVTTVVEFIRKLTLQTKNLSWV